LAGRRRRRARGSRKAVTQIWRGCRLIFLVFPIMDWTGILTVLSLAIHIISKEEFFSPRGKHSVATQNRGPVGHYDVPRRRSGRVTGADEVAARRWVPEGQLKRVAPPLRRALEGDEVGAGSRLRVELGDVSRAAAGGHLEVLKSEQEHDCSWGAWCVTAPLCMCSMGACAEVGVRARLRVERERHSCTRRIE